MAVHTYIGARYVPRFTGTYDPTQIYEALDVVDNGSGTSYIAKKQTPAGTPLTDTDYWFVYGSSSGAIINLQQQIDAIHDNLRDAFVSPMDFGAVDDGVTDNTQAVQDALDTGYPVYIKNGIKYDKTQLVLPSNAIIYDEYKSGYIRLITNGNEGGSVNETVLEAPYHPALVLDVNDQLDDNGVKLPTQTETLAAVVYRHNNNGKWALRADFGEDQFRIEHHDSYYQPVLIKPYAVIINNRDYVGEAENYNHTLFVNGNIACKGTNSSFLGFRIVDAGENLLKFAQLGFDTAGFKIYDSTTSPPAKSASIAYNGVAAFNTVSVHYHTTAQIKAFDPSDFEIGTICLDITLGRPVILRSKNPMTWIDFAGTTVYTGNQ